MDYSKFYKMRKRKIMSLFKSVWPICVQSLNKYKDKDTDGIKCIEQISHLFEIPINVGNETKAGGCTDGKSITVNFKKGLPAFNFFIFFHELAHFNLHFDNSGGQKLSMRKKEIEADAFALLCCYYIFPNNYEQLLSFAVNNPKVNRLNK